MDQILKALKCVNCKQTLKKPVVLPCSHMICKSHTETGNKQVICLDCGATHSNNEIVFVKAVEDMINAKLASFEFGASHAAARKSLDEFNNLLDKNELTLKSFPDLISEKISELKNEVLLKREQIKLIVDQRADQIIENLEQYKNRCAENLNQISFKANLIQVEKTNKTAKIQCKEWSNQLNELKYDEENWKKIINECQSNSKEIQQKMDGLIDKIFLKELDSYKEKCEFFDKINCLSILKLNVRFS